MNNLVVILDASDYSRAMEFHIHQELELIEHKQSDSAGTATLAMQNADPT